MSKEKMNSPKKSDTMMYKAIADLAILCVGFFLLQAVSRNYVNVDRYDTWHAVFGIAAIVFAVIFAAGVVLAIIRKDALKKVGIIAAVSSGILAIGAWALYAFWYEPLPTMYFLLIAGCVLYLISLLYSADFFLIATLTTAAGGLFYVHGQQGAASIRTIVLYAVVAAALIGMLLLAKSAANTGKVTIKGKTVRLFNTKGAGPIPMYLCSVICLTCIVASLIFGGNFAHYCTYAAAGGLFIAACYYTIRLD